MITLLHSVSKENANTEVGNRLLVFIPSDAFNVVSSTSDRDYCSVRVQCLMEGRRSGRRLRGARSRHVKKAMSRAPCSLMHLFITMQLMRCLSASSVCDIVSRSRATLSKHIDAITCAMVNVTASTGEEGRDGRWRAADHHRYPNRFL